MQNIPMSFIREHLKEKTQTIKLKFEKKWWPVELIFYPDHGSGKLSTGWTLFARECKLVGGDVAVLELINKEDPELEVHIFKGY